MSTFPWSKKSYWSHNAIFFISAQRRRQRIAEVAERKVLYQDQMLTHKIIAAAIEVHKILGPGLLESAYKSCLSFELESIGLRYKREQDIPFIYKNRTIDSGFRIDFLVEDAIILELKSIETVLPVHKSQVLTYLRLTNKQIGLLINLKNSSLKGGDSSAA